MKNINVDEKEHFQWLKYLATKTFPECERKSDVTRKTKGRDNIPGCIMERTKSRKVLGP